MLPTGPATRPSVSGPCTTLTLMALRSLRRFVTRRLGIEALRAENLNQSLTLSAHQASLEQHVADLTALRDQLAALRNEARADTISQTILWSTMWNAADSTQPPLLVSVVLPTRNRAELLPRAVNSVLQQTNVRVELIVVDDASTDNTAAVLAGINDPRLIVLAGSGAGAAAARNLAISHATGDIVAFADDDNIMAAGWLAAAARHLLRHDDIVGVYGAQIREPENEGDIQLLYRTPFSRDEMLRGPFIDLGATAFRADTAELHFDETINALLDWDMFIRITAKQQIEAIPVLACFYTTSAPERISRRPDKAEALRTVQARAAAELKIS